MSLPKDYAKDVYVNCRANSKSHVTITSPILLSFSLFRADKYVNIELFVIKMQ